MLNVRRAVWLASHRLAEEVVGWVVHPLVCGEEQVVDHGTQVEAALTLAGCGMDWHPKRKDQTQGTRGTKQVGAKQSKAQQRKATPLPVP